MSFDEGTREMLLEAWAYCDEEDKSTEFMFSYMADMAGVDYDDAVEFVVMTTEEERDAWYAERNPDVE